MKRNYLVLIALLLFPLAAFGQYPWSSILPSANGIDWSQSGVPGGIPSGSWTQSGSTIQASQCSNGSSDCTSTIQSALNSCGSSHYVLLGAGTFLIKSGISVPSYCALRGSGANQTILNITGTGGGAPVSLGGGSVGYSNVLNITSGATAGSTSIVLSGNSGVTVGGYLVISETNDDVVVDIRGGEGNCTWCDGWTSDGHLASGQIVQVTSVSSTTVGISPGLYRAYTNTPMAVPFTAAATYAGVEALQIYANNTGYGQDFMLSQCAYCWVKGVESNYTDGDFVDVYWGYRDEIRDSYFSNAYKHAPGTADSDVSLLNKTSGTLVENNIVERGHASIFMSWGAAGNVVAYNYCEGGFDQNSQNAVMGGIGMHGAHPQFNLLEGNVTPGITPDEIWGSNAYNTFFRNWAEGTTLACLPLTGRGTVTCSPVGAYGASGVNGWWPFQMSRALELNHLSTYFSMVGNVAGSANQTALLEYGTAATTHVGMLEYPSNRSYDSINYNMDFGYGEGSDGGTGTGCSGSTNPPCHSTTAYQTAFLHGNYTFADGNINWLSGVTQSLPPSFYQSSKPAWWGALAYPAIGPDVTGGQGANGHANLIPAQNCYFNVMGGSEGGAGSPLTFNAGQCYQTVQPVPPTTVVATPH